MQLHRHAMFYQADEMLINSVMYMRMLRWVGPKTSAVQSDIRMSTRRLGFVLSTERLNEANNKNAAKSSSLGHKSAIKFIYTLDYVFMNRSIISYNVFR